MSAQVSVITPFFNTGQWLAEAIESVLAQTFPDWELILIDDGSEPEHSGIAIRYCKENPERIKYLQHEGHANRGVAASRNLAFQHASGPYIAFLDSDDRWLPQKLEKQLKIFEQYSQASMILEASLFWYSWKDARAMDITTPVGADADRIYEPRELLSILYPLGKGSPPCPTGIMVKTKAIVDAGGFDESFIGNNQLYEDQSLLCKLYAKETVYVSAQANNLYRKRPGSLTELADDENIYYAARNYFLDWYENYAREHLKNNDAILSLIDRARRRD